VRSCIYVEPIRVCTQLLGSICQNFYNLYKIVDTSVCIVCIYKFVQIVKILTNAAQKLSTYSNGFHIYTAPHMPLTPVNLFPLT
jgi:hypothetical protein